MTKAIGQHIGRRAMLKGSAAITATTARATIPAIAGTRDPILDLIAEVNQLFALATAASDRANAAAKSVGCDCAAAFAIDLSMAHVPATSLAGVLIKARTARLYTTGDDFEELDNLWLSIADDLERLVGGARSA